MRCSLLAWVYLSVVSLPSWTLVCATAAAQPDAGVCGLALSQLYVRDASATAFPTGFLPCVGVDHSTNARCQACDCRDLEMVKNAGNAISWGVCVEKTVSLCERSTAPNRKQCNATTPAPAPTTTAAPTVFRPGNVQAGGEGSASATAAANGTTQQLAMDAGTGLSTTATEKESPTASILIVVCAVAGVAGVVLLVFVKTRDGDKEPGTPKDETYRDSDTSKARGKRLTPPHKRGRAAVGQAYRADSADPTGAYVAKQHQHLQQYAPSQQSLSLTSERRDTYVMGEEDELELNFVASPVAPPPRNRGFAELAGGQSFISEINLDTSRSLNCDDLADDEYDDDTSRSRFTVDDDGEDEDVEFDPTLTTDSSTSSSYWYGSSESMLFSNSSALTYYEDDDATDTAEKKEPRQSIEF